METACFIHYTPFSCWFYDHLCWFDLYNWTLHSIPNLLWLSLIMTFMYICKEFTGKNLFRIIILIWKLHVSSITHPFHADVTIICVDLICIIERFIQSQICYDYHWSWHLCIVVRNSLAKSVSYNYFDMKTTCFIHYTPLSR